MIKPPDLRLPSLRDPMTPETDEAAETKVDLFSERWEDFFCDTEHRFEKVQAQFQKMHEMYRMQFRQMQSKIAGLIGWANERKKNDPDWFETVENHQHTLQAIEARMQSWQRLMSEQELQLLTASSEKSRMEKLQSYWQRQFEGVQNAIQEIRAGLENSKTTSQERQVETLATAEMLERQRRLIQSFELRLRQSEKVISEQELQLASSRAELKEAMKELIRLKGR